MSPTEKNLYRRCWKNNKLPGDYGYPFYDYDYLSGRRWATMEGQVVFFDD